MSLPLSAAITKLLMEEALSAPEKAAILTLIGGATTAQGAKAYTAYQAADASATFSSGKLVTWGTSASALVTALTTQTDTASTSILLTAVDNGKIIRCTAATAVTITMPSSDPGAGWSVMVIQAGTGQITFAPGSGNTLNSYGALLRTAGQHASASLIRVASATYNLGGNLS